MFDQGLLFVAQIFKIKETIEEISGIASGEYALELQLEKIEKVQKYLTCTFHENVCKRLFVLQAWKELSFSVKGYRETKDVFILGGLDEVFAQVRFLVSNRIAEMNFSML